MNPLIGDAVFAPESEAGTVYGPIIDGDKVRLVKVNKFLSTADSVKARHILISTRELDEATAMNRADSLLKAVKGGADFAELARKFSEDPGSGAQGGDLGWFTEGQMVPEFNDACFNGKVGDLTVVKTQYGAHLIYIQEKTAPNKKANVSYLDRTIEPSGKTIDEYYAKANDFAVNARDAESFESEAKNRDLYVVSYDNLKASDRQVNDLGNSREITQWSYNPDREIGEVSKVFDLDGKYVVALLKGVKEKGFPPFDQLRASIEPLAKREKKAAEFVAEMQKAAAGKSDMDAIGSALNLPVEQANYNFSTYAIPGASNEPYVVGVTFGLAKGKISSPIKGKSACFIIVVDNETPANVPEDLDAQKKNLKQILSNRAAGNVNSALTKLAKVEDHRYKFF
ncbi:MAG: peptidylprolyl isomerase [Bacteroidia bacterium]